MDRHPDRHVQRLIDDAAAEHSRAGSSGTMSFPGHDNDPISGLEFRSALQNCQARFNDTMDFSAESQDWASGLGIRPVMQPPSMYSGFGRSSYEANPQPTSSFGASPGLSRLSFAPRNTSTQKSYNQVEAQPRTLSNADNHFRFTQNLRQGMPLTQAQPRPHITQSAEPIDQLVNSMLMQEPLPQARPHFAAALQTDYGRQPEPANFFQGLHTSRLGQLQPQRQQVTPPFNLSGFVYSPTGRHESESSSPIAGQGSSPSARASLRRASNNMPPSSTQARGQRQDVQDPLPETPRRQATFPKKHTPQTLALGHAPPMAHGVQLVSPHDLPDRFRHVFPYELFNAVQSKCFDSIYKSNDNIVVSAPTGSGKTVLLELAICKLVGGHQSGQFKLVYMAPTKSLCSERLRDWEKKFSHLNLLCAELTGDTNQAEMARVRNASIIVTTPEKWDSITRKWDDHVKLVQMVKLFLIDEVHILKDTRGATLEAVVSRMKSMGSDLRFVALSATVPNSHDIALWLGRDHTNQHLPAHRETFGEDYRPVKLMKWVHGFDGMMNDFAFEKILDGKLPGLIHHYNQKKPIMVFCFTRKSCESTAGLLAENWGRQRVIDRPWPAPAQRTAVGSKELQQLVTSGVAFHHAGLDPEDRHAIERAFLKGDISVICCTSTLAVGVNLPCHLVILKGTVGFQDGKLCEYSDLEVMQMLGRAGRPQFDDKAVAVIMTRSDQVERYKKMISGQNILESTLHLNLIEHLNSEISLGIVNNLHKAKRWIYGTFLSVRMRQNPAHYKIAGVADGGNVDDRLAQVCERDIKLLQEHNLVTDEESFQCTPYGKAMTRYMVQFQTMKLLLDIPEQAKMEQILHAICQAMEFKDLRMKPAERPFLREFNKSPFIKFPVKEAVTTTAHKVSLMIQVQLGGVNLPTNKEFTLVKRQFGTDKSIIFDRIQRLIRCVIDCKAFDGDGVSTRHALDLARSLSAEYWENSNLQLRQIPQVGPAAHRKLIQSDIKTVEQLAGLDTASIERAMSKNPPYGKKTKDLLASFPRLNLTAEITGRANSKHGHNPKVIVVAHLSYSNDKVPVWNGRRPSLTFMVETSDGKLAYIWRGSIARLENGYDLDFPVTSSRPEETITIRLACEEVVGTTKSFTLHHNTPASAFPTPSPSTGTKAGSTDDTNKVHNEVDDFGDDDLGDEDMLAALKGVEATELPGSDDFADIDDIEAKTTKPKKKTKPAKRESTMKGSVKESMHNDPDDTNETEVLESVQMANGKWTCNHVCRDGAPCKNGKPCKHRCCKEGLDKPRKLKKPSTKSQTNTDAKPSGKKKKTKKSSQDLSQVKFNPENFNSPQASDTELVDLVRVPSPVGYEKVAPREYRKLHDLHTKVQSDKSIRLPKNKKPQFSHSTGEQPKLPYLQKDDEPEESFDTPDSDDLQDFDMPTGAGNLHGDMDMFTETFFQETPENDVDEDALHSSYQDESMNSLEQGMMELTDPSLTFALPAAPTGAGASFSNGVFDFEAYENINDIHESFLGQGHPKEEPFSSQASHNPSKRPLSASGEESEAKYRRLTKDDEPATGTQQSQFPDWVKDADPALIDQLKDYVDFV
ncbi:related to ATP-dependent DNA helicase [Phialocephala subalpina]|uniref:DNA 3'-5' helicase n=1 Tax=Phialocephala subalpina TaxID=576137 RepID=A0A1L7WWH2_9HELO|nr:related to ATP-dependent DNA helicase [Phialocephala subalpina]